MNLKQIDLMSRESLVNLGIKLQLNGHKNMFSKPYIKKIPLKKDFVKKFDNIESAFAKTAKDNNVQDTSPSGGPVDI